MNPFLSDSEPVRPSHLTSPIFSTSNCMIESKVKEITVHGLRHTHATALITKRPDHEVARRLGNALEMIQTT